MRKNRVNIYFLLFVLSGIVFLDSSHSVYAIVGQAERFDEFEEQRLDEFQELLLKESKIEEIDPQGDYMATLEQKSAELENVDDEELQKALKEEIEMLKSKLLQIPKRDRFKVEMKGDYTYDSNIVRNVPRAEKGDSVFDLRKTLLFDLSGKKTDLRFDLNAQKQWNIVFSEKDAYLLEERLRFRRRFFKKLNTSFNSRIARHNSKTIEIDGKKIRYDFNNQMAFNLPLSKKLSLNTSFSQAKRYFPQEAFDQDSGWSVGASPSMFWDVTPKSRVSLGYSFGANRSRVKSGDSNQHGVSLGYFGQLTRKSSVSMTIAYDKQVPRSLDTAKSNTYTVGLGSIWQLTSKSQVTLQYIRALQNTTSELASGEVDGANTVTRTDSHFINENVSVSFNTRIKQKISAGINLAAAHTRTKTFEGGSKDLEARQFSFPISATLSYQVRKWMSLQFSYRFGFRTGDEKPETYRAHTWLSSMRLIF